MNLWLIVGSLFLSGFESATPPAALARRIDERIQARLDADKVPAAPVSSDEEFLRRLSLDLLGRIPTAEDVLTFVNDSRPDKRALLVDAFLQDPAYPKHVARVYRALLLPEAETEPQIQYFIPGFEAWLEKRLSEKAGFNDVVRELLTVSISGPEGPPEFVLRDLRRPNPLAYIAVKNAEPAKIASSSIRTFLGLRLECAQCHNHPFDHWSRKQFWNQAAFFAGIQRRGKGLFAPVVEVKNQSTIALGETKDNVSALFLDESQPQLDGRQPPRAVLAEWMTSPRNPYFAKATANRVWAQLMGLGIVNPVDDFGDANPPSHPELLDDLAEALKEWSFDVTRLTKAICLSSTYQRTSRQTDPTQAPPELFARRTIKALSREQFIDSFSQTICFVPPDSPDNDDEGNAIRREILNLFTDESQSGAPETSVAQALALMNSSVIQRNVTSDNSERLKRILKEFPDVREKQVEALYLVTLSRRPTAEETSALVEFLSQASPDKHPRRLGDVFWMLLNSPEFRWNH